MVSTAPSKQAAGVAEPPVRFSGGAFLLFFALCLAVNWPGRLNEDSLHQFLGFHDRAALDDVHSPVVAWLWSPLDWLAGQPASALIVQAALLSFYAAMLPSPLPRRGRLLVAALAEAVVKLSLVVLAGFVIKDTLLVGFLLAGLAALQRALCSERPAPWFGATAAFVLLALFVRPTNVVMMLAAAAVVVPLVVRTWRSRAIVFAAASVLFVSTVPVSAAINLYLLGANRGHAEIQLFLFDGAGMSAWTGKDLLRELPGWPAGLPDPRRCYRPSEAAIYAPWSPCAGYAEAGWQLYQRGRRQVVSWWLRNIAAHPTAYLAHRLQFSAHLLDPVGAVRGHPVYQASGGDQYVRYLYALNHPRHEARLHRMTGGSVAPNRFAPWRENALTIGFARLTNLLLGSRAAVATALLASLLILAWTAVRRLRGRSVPSLAAVAAAAMAAGNFLMHMTIGIGSQERYLYPTVYCAAFAVLVLLRAARARSPTVRWRNAAPSI